MKQINGHEFRYGVMPRDARRVPPRAKRIARLRRAINEMDIRARLSEQVHGHRDLAITKHLNRLRDELDELMTGGDGDDAHDAHAAATNKTNGGKK